MREKLHKKETYIWIMRIVTGLFTLCWMLVIGSFSAQTGQQSGSLSGAVAEQILMVEEHLLQREYTDAEREEKIEAMQLPIRKLAHMTEYGLLALFLAMHFGYYAFAEKNIRLRLFLSWLTATVYAATDEIHQLFVDGRSGQFTDVCIDSAGALAGVLFFFLVLSTAKKYKKNRIDKKYQEN